jgi:hypothetical protein
MPKPTARRLDGCCCEKSMVIPEVTTRCCISEDGGACIGF